MVEKGTRGGISHETHRYTKAKISISKIMKKTLNHHTSCI